MHRLPAFAILLLASASSAFAEAVGPGAVPDVTSPAGPGATGPQAAPGPLAQFMPILMLVGLFAFMYFVIIRPQRKEEKRRKELVDSIKRGDEVTTIGGAHGVVETVGEQTVDVRLGVGAKAGEGLVVRYTKGAISANVSAEQTSSKGK